MNTSQLGDEDGTDGPLLFGRILDGRGGARPIDWAAARDLPPMRDGETLWLHLDRTADELEPWLRATLGMSEQTAALLVSNETRPRAFREGDQLIAVLRGVNFNQGSDPEDMIALQLWGLSGCVLSLRRRRLQSPRDVLAQIDRGAGPKTTGELVVALMETLVARMGLAVIDMNERLDAIEAMPKDKADDDALSEISSIRHACLALKRFMSPQHEALSDIVRTPPDWLSSDNVRDVRETIDRLKRYLEDLDVSKESAIVLQDDFDSRAAAASNRTMYVLSIVAAVFLPLSFITGLLGINVGGMPGVDSGIAFWVTVGVLALLLVIQLIIFRRLKWL